MTLEQLNTKRDELIAKIAAAERRLQAGDTSIEYFDISSMQRSLTVIDSEIAKKSGSTTGSVATFYTTEGL